MQGYNLCWLEAHAGFRDFMVVNYEALRANPRPDLERMVRFMRCRFVGSTDIDLAIANNTFARMKTREKSGELRGRFGDRFTRGGGADDRMIVRRGVIGGHNDELDAADREFCDELLRRYDYDRRLGELIARADPEAPLPR